MQNKELLEMRLRKGFKKSLAVLNILKYNLLPNYFQIVPYGNHSKDISKIVSCVLATPFLQLEQLSFYLLTFIYIDM